MITLAIISHVSLYREGLIRLLAQAPDLRVTGHTDSLQHAVSVLERETPDVVLVDLASTADLDGIRSLSSKFSRSRFLALGVAETSSAITLCAEVGIVGYVDCKGSVEDLVTAIRDTASGELRCSPQVAAALMERVASLSARKHMEMSTLSLTHRELEVLERLERGLTNKQIANDLAIAAATVRNHVHHILEKLGARTRGEAAAIGRRTNTDYLLSRASGPGHEVDHRLRPAPPHRGG